MNEKPISQELIQYLLEGLKNFRPAYFSKEPGEWIPQTSFDGFNKKDFEDIAQKITQTEEQPIDETIKTLQRWLTDPALAGNMPPEFEMANLIEKAEKRKMAAAETRQKVKEQIETVRVKSTTPSSSLPEPANQTTPTPITETQAPSEKTSVVEPEPAKKVEPSTETYIPTPTTINKSVLSLQKEAQETGPQFINKYAKEIQTNISAAQLPVGLMPQVAARKAAVRLYDAALSFNPVNSLSKTIFPKDEVSEKLITTIIPQPVVEKLVSPPPEPAAYIPTETFVPTPQSLVEGSTILFLAAPEIAKKDPEAGTAAVLASKGFVDPTQKEILLQQAKVFGINLSKQRADEIASLVSRYQYQFEGFARVATEANFSTLELQAFSQAPGLGYDQVYLPGQGGLRGVIGSIGQQLFGKAANKLLEKGLEKGVEKLAATAAARAGAGIAAETIAGGVAAGAAVGTAAIPIPIVGTIIGIVASLATKVLPVVLKWFKQHSEDLAVGSAAILLLGIFTGSLPLIAGGGVALSGLALSGAGAGTIKSAGSGLAHLFGVGFLTSFSEIAKPLAISLVSVPVLVALIMFIINSGAYLVPGGSTSTEGFITPGQVASGSCPLVGGATISTPSYNPTTEIGHGSNAYWNSVGGTSCRFQIPIPGMFPDCSGPSSTIPGYNSGNKCAKQSELCPYYGYAADVVSPSGTTAGRDVALPFLCGPNETDCPALDWNLSQGFWNCGATSTPLDKPCPNNNGMGLIFTATGNGHNWRLYITHIDKLPSVSVGENYASGTIIAKVASISFPHIHLELNIDGVPVKPESVMCGTAVAPPGNYVECKDGGRDITQQLASRISTGNIKYLPGSSQRKCIKPSLIVMHWSGSGNFNPDGNVRTYNTLVARQRACQVGVDTNDVQLWQHFFETMVEEPICANGWNAASVNIEMSGVGFTDDPPPPDLNQLNLTYEATCKIMQQYGIPWCQIRGHYEAPGIDCTDTSSPLCKFDPGKRFLYNVFIPEIKKRCPNDPSKACGG